MSELAVIAAGGVEQAIKRVVGEGLIVRVVHVLQERRDIARRVVLQFPIRDAVRAGGVCERGDPAVQVEGVAGMQGVAEGPLGKWSEQLIGQAGGHGLNGAGGIRLGGHGRDAAEAVA